MIIREFYETRFDGVNLYRTYSNTKHYIKQVQTGHIYSEAIDVESAPYTYIETEDLILEREEPENSEQDDKETEIYGKN